MTVVTTTKEFKDYLAEMTARADEISSRGWPEATNIEAMCAKMWKEFLPHAIDFWTMAGVLNLIAECIDPPKEDTDEGDDEDE